MIVGDAHLGAAVLRARDGESLEDEGLVLVRDAGAGIGNLEEELDLVVVLRRACGTRPRERGGHGCQRRPSKGWRWVEIRGDGDAARWGGHRCQRRPSKAIEGLEVWGDLGRWHTSDATRE